VARKLLAERNMKKITNGIVLSLALLAPAVARADGDTIFQTVDQVEIVYMSRLNITGLVDGEATPRTVLFSFYYDYNTGTGPARSCERAALLTMNRPGRYRLTIREQTDQATGCFLKRNP
jgi:hypothetical protein